MQPVIGDRIDRFVIEGIIGEGGMARVYKARDTRLNRPVALKLIRKELFGDAVLLEIRRRFEREALSLASMTHPNIVNVFDYGEYNGAPYLVLAYLSGGTLRERTGKPLPSAEASAMLVPIARALGYAHQQGIIHRDIKPSNIMFSPSGDPLLTDFGIVKLVEGGSANAALTTTGVTIGTPEYMAPEQGLGKEIDERADIYALGVVFYELLTGRRPFHADTPMQVLLKHVSEPLPNPLLLAPDLSPESQAVLKKALAKEPADRYQSMGELSAALTSLAGSPDSRPTLRAAVVPPPAPTTPPPVASTPQPRTPSSPPTGGQPAATPSGISQATVIPPPPTGGHTLTTPFPPPAGPRTSPIPTPPPGGQGSPTGSAAESMPTLTPESLLGSPPAAGGATQVGRSGELPPQKPPLPGRVPPARTPPPQAPVGEEEEKRKFPVLIFAGIFIVLLVVVGGIIAYNQFLGPNSQAGAVPTFTLFVFATEEESGQGAGGALGDMTATPTGEGTLETPTTTPTETPTSEGPGEASPEPTQDTAATVSAGMPSATNVPPSATKPPAAVKSKTPTPVPPTATNTLIPPTMTATKTLVPPTVTLTNTPVTPVAEVSASVGISCSPFRCTFPLSKGQSISFDGTVTNLLKDAITVTIEQYLTEPCTRRTTVFNTVKQIINGGAKYTVSYPHTISKDLTCVGTYVYGINVYAKITYNDYMKFDIR